MRSGTLIAVMAGGAMPVVGYAFERADDAGLDALLRAARARPTAAVVEAPMLEMIEVPAESTVFWFTREGHLAHPSVLVRRIVQPETGPAVEVFGYTAASDGAMAEWLDQFRAGDEAVRSGRFSVDRLP